jgi:hypothetical protein
MTLAPQTQLGRYEIRSLIGAGGMGEVYLAQDTSLNRKVALKVLPADVASNQDRMRRFKQNAAKRKNVGAVIDLARLALRLFRRHVTHRSEDQAGRRVLLQDSGFFAAWNTVCGSLRLDEFGESEVEDLRVTVGRDHDVVGFQIAMNDTGVVCFRKSFGDVLQGAQEPGEVFVLFMHLVAQRGAVDVLHRDEVQIV